MSKLYELIEKAELTISARQVHAKGIAVFLLVAAMLLVVVFG